MTLSQLSPYRLPLALTLCVTLIALGGSELWAIFRFDREVILHGQVWRLFSGHLSHLGWSHWGMNVAALAVIWALVGDRFSNRQWLWIFAGVCLMISLGLLIFNPALTWYVGLSGLLHGMLVAGGLADIRSGHRSGYALLILVGTKLIWEQVAGPLPGSALTAGGAVIIDAHLYGGLGGLVFGSLLKPKPSRQQT